MKILLSIISIFALFQLSAARYELGTKHRPAYAEVTAGKNLLKIECTFKAAEKFSPDRNAMINRRRADDYCQKALLLHLNAAPGETFDLSGIAIDGTPRKSGSMITYNFIAAAPRKMHSGKKNLPGNSGKPNQTAAVKKSKSSLTVIRYQSENHQVKVVSSKVYPENSFKNRDEFEIFCQKQFDEINQQAEINRQQVIDSYNQARKSIIDRH
ncbi:MAG: hypothetical protein IJW33_05025 [Lentisphaeria bacterium]|nr:hypothetical protein [Lentisphaeria bacterium]